MAPHGTAIPWTARTHPKICSPRLMVIHRAMWITGKWFYPADLPLEAVRQLADGVPVTKELVAALNPKRNEWEEIKTGLDKIGYPHEL